jgi:hypothetical protein
MRVFAAVLALAVLAMPAYAQRGGGGSREESPVEKIYQNKLKEQAEIDRQYKESVGHTRGATDGKIDPWANIRPANPPASNKPAR